MNNPQDNLSPFVSVVMPAYNGARTLMDAVNSVLAQTYHDLELIICNDASTDGTVDLLKNITDDRVRIITNPRNLGEGATRDRAIDMVRGAWIAVIDADDAWAPERLEVMMRETEGSVDKIIFDNIIECHDTPSGMVPWRIMRGVKDFGGDGINAVEVPVEHFIRETRLLIKPLFPAKLLKIYDVRHTSLPFAADTEFFLKILAHGIRLFYIPKPMYYYRITPGSMSALARRSSMMRGVLENAVSQFSHNPRIQAALQKKITMVTRNEQYMPFILALKNQQIIEAIKLVWRRLWIIPEFFKRTIKSIIYHVHRISHGGRHRGIR